MSFPLSCTFCPWGILFKSTNSALLTACRSVCTSAFSLNENYIGSKDLITLGMEVSKMLISLEID